MAKKQVRLTGQQIEAMFGREKVKLEELQRRQSLLQQALWEVATTIDSLKSIKAAEENEKMLVSLGTGIYAEAALLSKKVKTLLAGKIMLQKDIESTLKELNERQSGLRNQLKDLNAERQRALKSVTGLGQVLSTAKKAVRQKAREQRKEKAQKAGEKKK